MDIISKLEKIKVLDKIIEFSSNNLLSLIRKYYVKKNVADGSVVIISLHKIGDTVFTIPAIKKIFEHFANKKIYIITFTENKAIYKIALPNSSICTVKKESFILGGRIALRSAKIILNNMKPETIFDLTGTITSATLIVNSSAKNIVGLNSKYYKTLYDYYTPIRIAPHLIDRYIDVIKLFIPVVDSEIEKEFPINISTEGKIFICPLAGWKAKEWGIDNFVNLSNLLNKNYEVEIIVEKNKLSVEELKKFEINKISITQTTSLEELINNIKDCSVFISNDSGPLYIANLLGKPTFTIYGPTNPEYSLPFGKFHKFAQKKISCSPDGTQYCYLQAGLKCPSYECMHQLSVGEVYANINCFLMDIKITSRNKNKKNILS